MKYLLDTVVLSEYICKRPVQSVIDWLDEQDEQTLLISVLTIAELKKGYYKLAKGQPNSGHRERAQKILDWIHLVEHRFQERILSVDADILEVWANLCGISESRGKSLPVFDSLIAATAKRYQLVIVTRNIADFQNCSSTIELLNPYDV